MLRRKRSTQGNETDERFAINLPAFTHGIFELPFFRQDLLSGDPMDTLTKAQIQRALSQRLRNCRVTCTINPDSSLSITVLAPDANQFTIANINRARYHGESGINRLVREILEDMVVSRKTSRLSSVG